MIEIRVPSGNYVLIEAEAGDSIEFHVESYGQGLIDQDDLHAQAQGLTVCDQPKQFHAINASPYEMRLLLSTSDDSQDTINT